MDEALSKIKIESLNFPGMAGPSTRSGGKNLKNFRVRYQRLDMTSPSDVAELENIETKGITGDEVVLLGKVNYMFMDKFFFVITYLEKASGPTVNSPTPGPDLSFVVTP